jgi:ferritin
MKLINLKSKSNANFQTVIKIRRHILNEVISYIDNILINYKFYDCLINKIDFEDIYFICFYIEEQIKETKKLKKVINHGRK